MSKRPTASRDLLPDPCSRKKHKGEVAKAFLLLQEVDIFTSSKFAKLTSDQLLCLLINKFGWSVVSTIASVVNSLPKVLPKQLFSMYLERKCIERGALLPIQVDELVQLLEDECGQFVSSFHKETLVLAPVLAECPMCRSRLVSHHNCMAKVYELDGATTLPKVTLRCIACNLYFGYSRFGNTSLGFRYYENERPYVEATDTVFVNRRLLEFQCSLA